MRSSPEQHERSSSPRSPCPRRRSHHLQASALSDTPHCRDYPVPDSVPVPEPSLRLPTSLTSLLLASYAAIFCSFPAHIARMSVVSTCSSDETLLSLSVRSAVSRASSARCSDSGSHEPAADAHAATAVPQGRPVYADPDCFNRFQ